MDERKTQNFCINYNEIEEIVIEHFGLRIWLKKSGKTFSFKIKDIRVKTKLAQAISSNSYLYLNLKLDIRVTESSKSLAVF